MPRINGINMIDVKRNNRSSILNLIYQKDRLSRKEIAGILGLTPAAITLITSDLLEEGLISEDYPEQTSNHKGRKEVYLSLNTSKYAAIGVYVSPHRLHIQCADMNSTVIFRETTHTADCHNQSVEILDKLCSIIEENLKNYDVFRKYRLLGIGVSINGIVDPVTGVSINSYHTWEERVPVRDYIESKLGYPVIVTNNICAAANGESYLSKTKHPSNSLFIKYGPGIGGARNHSRNSSSIYDYVPVELGHMIMDINGEPCICGNRGCLETIISYAAIEKTISNLMSPQNTPLLYELTQGNPENLTIQYVMQSYSAQERPVVSVVERVVTYLSLAIQNTLSLFDPYRLILYGELFEVPKFKQALIDALDNFSVAGRVRFSHFNLRLETFGPLTTIINSFFENGGVPLPLHTDSRPDGDDLT